jgi:hypothetical protein
MSAAMRLGSAAAVALFLASIVGLGSAHPAQLAKRVSLRVVVTGRGLVVSTPRAVACPPKCGATVAKGKSVKLRAEPASGWTFTRWRGACSAKAATCKVRMSGAKKVAAVFAPVPPAPPPPPPPPTSFTPQLLAGTWSGTWTDTTYNTTGTANIVVTLADGNAFRFVANFGGTIFGCPQQPTVSAAVMPGPGPNQWNAAGFLIQLLGGPSGSASLSFDFNLRTLDGSGTPACRPTVTWALTGGFTPDFTSFNGQVTTRLEDGTTAPALLSLTRSS